MKTTQPILIVGAGPTGLTAALELSRLGVPVRLMDRKPEPSTTSRALAVQARTLELLDRRGPGPEMVRLGQRAVATTLHSDGKLLGRVRLTEIPSRHNYVLLLSQAETERLLREQVARQGVHVERGVEMIAFAQGEEGVRAVLRHPGGNLEELAAAYLVCAEGAHSTVRRTLNLPFAGKSLPESYALGDLYIDGDLPDDELTIFAPAKGGLAAAFPMGNRHFRFLSTEPEDHPSDAGDPSLEELQRLYDASSHLPARLHDVTWSSRFRINSRLLGRLREERVFFGGDAAHIHSPAGGQGMNTGIQDMINLGWKLAAVWHGHADPGLLDTYEAERLPVIRDIVQRTEAATEALNSRSPLVHGLVTHLVPVLLDAHFVQRVGTSGLSQVAVHYRPSPLSRNEHPGGDLRAGDRVPDVQVLTAEPHGSSSKAASESLLQDLLDPSRLTLLLANGEETGEPGHDGRKLLAPWRGLVRIQPVVPAANAPDAAHFKQLFGQNGGLLLVRPDGYLACAADRQGWGKLKEWLNQWFPAPAPPGPSS